MNIMRKSINTYILFIILSFLLLTCAKPADFDNKAYQYASFRDVPGITEDEIKAVEALKEKHDVFVYGMIMTNETFYDEDGKIRGFSALVCNWLTKLFEIQFKPAIYTWNDLLSGLASGEIDFSGELTATPERRRTYYMTDAIAERSIKYMRLAGSAPLQSIAALRPQRYAFLEGSTTVNNISTHLSNENFEIILVDNCDTAYSLLKNGEADAFFGEGVEASFDIYADVAAYDVFPVIYGQVSLTTQKHDYIPVISVMQKVLENDGLRYLTELHNSGEQDYMRHKLSIRLTEEERNFILNNPVISFAVENDTYPVSFYDTRNKEWQGIAVDVLKEVGLLTDLSFKVINSPQTQWPVLLKMLEDGEIDLLMLSQSRLLMYTHFHEHVGFKANIIFDYPFESTFGFYRNEAVLASIVDKALNLVDTKGITNYWISKSYDYRRKLVETQRPLLIGVSAMTLCVLILLIILF